MVSLRLHIKKLNLSLSLLTSKFTCVGDCNCVLHFQNMCLSEYLISESFEVALIQYLVSLWLDYFMPRKHLSSFRAKTVSQNGDILAKLGGMVDSASRDPF